MPSMSHQALVTLLRDNPALGVYLFEVATGKKLLPGTELQLTSAQLTDLQPPEYSSDATFLITGDATDTAEHGPVVYADIAGNGAVIYEIQMGRDDKKPSSWLRYAGTMHYQIQAPVTVIVIAIDESIAKWCAKPHGYDHAGLNIFTPTVLGPQQIPRIIDPSQAQRMPALAVLSVAAHGSEDGAEQIALAALSACNALDTDRGTQYADFVFGWLSEAARIALEELMAQQGYEYQSNFAKGYFVQGREAGVISGIEALCKVLDIEITSDRREQLEEASIDQLERILEALSSERYWPS